MSLPVDDVYCDPNNPIKINFADITHAAYMIKGGVYNTICYKSELLQKITGVDLYLKKDFLQATGSFKERGARFAMMQLTPEQKKAGIVAASAGNHAQACCYHGYQLGIPVTVCMPVTAPIMKVQKCINYHGNVIIEGATLTETKAFAIKYAKENGQMYLNGYDHPQILAGQGTIGLEIYEQVPDMEAVIIPVGGGGLIAGVACAVKTLNPCIKVYGVEPQRAACFTKALESGVPAPCEISATLADGLQVQTMGVNAYETARHYVDKVVTVQEEYIALAILRLAELEKSVVEGAGASPLAAILSGQCDELKGKRTVLIISGGNIDTTTLGRILERGLVSDGRLIKFKVTVSDRPGGISGLISFINAMGVGVKDIFQERAWIKFDNFSVEAKCICEVRDYQHGIELRDALVEKYGTVIFNNVTYPG